MLEKLASYDSLCFHSHQPRGYIARENGDVDWLSGAEGEGSVEDYGYQEFMDSVDVVVIGRNLYEKVLSFGKWPGNRLAASMRHDNFLWTAGRRDNSDYLCRWGLGGRGVFGFEAAHLALA